MAGEERKYKIMIVEDSEIQVVVLRHILEQQGWEVLEANSAEQALDALSKSTDEESPGLIIIDYHLPGIQGDELCRRLKLNINTRSIPILMLTVEDDEESQRHGLESGADDYLPKPTDDDILVLKIKSLLRKSRESHVLFGIGSSLFQSSRILAVDNSLTYLEFLAEAFKEDGIRIDKAFGGSEALEKIKEKKYDCVLVDLALPEIDGIEICKNILEMRRSLEEPLVMILMAHESKEDMARALEAGADDFVGKSCDISIIKARVIALLRRKFILEDNQRIFEELKRKELEVERSRIEKAAAEAKAVLAEKLLNTVEQLEEEIEEGKRMEEKIKNYSYELERSNKELEAFAYVVSHDLQEPLRAISGYLRLVEKRYKDKLDDKGKDFINRGVSGARRMQEMINDLLVYSRITTSAGSFVPCCFEKILDQALTNLSAAIERSQAKITRDPMPGFYCDESQVLRLFQNLISNAIKFCDRSRPVIHLSARQLNQKGKGKGKRKHKHKGEDEWLFSIKDNGIGIDPAYKETVFKIFQRVHGKGKYPGTGIGLAICQKIVERHGGKIWVESEPGKGSMFFFTIKTKMIENRG
ncbi:MAG: response regulator [Candidatus Aminicenantes bacterium]|nr:MAG: response regulator [Candidatus Aminicenantes bacterium]